MKDVIIKKVILAAASIVIASPLLAQQTEMPAMDHSKMPAPADQRPMPPMTPQQKPMMDHSNMPMMEKGDMMAMMNDPANPYGASEMDMHKKMMMAKAGQPSELWTRKMIEHHRGAIAMSRVALEKATDRQTRSMAQMTINAQTREIAKMQAWLKSHGKSVQ